MKLKHILPHGAILLVIFLIAAGPILVSMAAGTIAEANGCRLHEGFPEPCIINGVDRGEDLYTYGVLGLLSLGTIPLGLLLFAVYLAVVVIVWIVRRNKQAKAGA